MASLLTSLFGGSRNTKTKTSGNTTNNSVITPNVPSQFLTPLTAYANNIAGFQSFTPETIDATVAKASPLQQQAFSQAGQLGGWKGWLGSARSAAEGIAAGGNPILGVRPTMGAMQGYNPAQGMAQGYQAAAPGQAQGYTAAQGTCLLYTSPSPRDS